MKILAVIDMQNDFIDGSLGSKEAAATVPCVVKKIREFGGDKIFLTRDTHSENYLETFEGKKLPVRHCIKGTPGWELHPEVAAAAGLAEVIDKPTFASEELAKKNCSLAGNGAPEIELIGLCTDICVVSNALFLRAKLPDAKITVDAACCAGVTPESHRAALLTMKMCQIDIINE